MDPENFCRFILLDFGHPMNTNTINNIIKSLENTLTLGLAFSRKAKELILGVAILNSEFSIFGLQSELQRNYDSIITNLNSALKMKKINSRVTVQEYRHLLSSSIEVILHEFQKLHKANNTCNELPHRKIQVAVITRKTASVLADILVDVTNKLQKNNPDMSSVKNFKVVQILNADDTSKGISENKLIDWMSCSDTIHSLDCFFKEWLLNQKQQLRILLSKDLNLEVKCDVEDCIINPVSMIFDGRFDLFDDIRSKSKNSSNSSLGTHKLDLEILHRIPISGFCPTFVYSIPRRIYPTGLPSKWLESQINSKIFKQLCQKLYQTGQGLLAKLILPIEKNKLQTFHFLTSDGDILLMNDIAPEELYLPSRIELEKAADYVEDESAASMVQTCFEKIKPLDEYNPKYFSSGIYDCLKDYLTRVSQSRSLFGHDPDRKLFGKNCGKDKSDLKRSFKSCTNDNKTRNGPEKGEKRQKTTSGSELENVHPALLSQNIVEKYRKINSKAFNIPELSKDYN